MYEEAVVAASESCVRINVENIAVLDPMPLDFKEAKAPPRINRQMCDRTQYGRQKHQ